MQPYIFPYLGYFQLIAAVDAFVFYDDVNYIKGGWVNRNRILVHGNEKFITFPCDKASPNKLISEIDLVVKHPLFKKQLRTIKQSYRKAPYFDSVFPLIESIFDDRPEKLSEFAMLGIERILDFLDISKELYVSSKNFNDTKDFDRTDRLIEICTSLKADTYINSAGGKELYSKKDFMEHNIQLKFLIPELTEYEQFKQEFVPGLSIIDVLMFNSKDKVVDLMKNYSLE